MKEYFSLKVSIESTGRAWEHDSLYGHSNNVCSAVFHDKLVSGGKKIHLIYLFLGRYCDKF